MLEEFSYHFLFMFFFYVSLNSVLFAQSYKVRLTAVPFYPIEYKPPKENYETKTVSKSMTLDSTLNAN